MSNQVLDTIFERRSIREYKPDKLSKEQIDTLLKAASEAPTARNAQPWHITVVQDQSVLADLNEGIGTTAYGKIDVFYAAPAVFIISRDSSNPFSPVDTGIVVQTIALAAYSIGLGSVVLGLPAQAFFGDKADYYKKLLKFPAGYEFGIAIAAGYAASTKEPHPIAEGHFDFV